MAWSSIVAEILKFINKLLDHSLKPAIEKMKDIRFANYKKWIKWKKKSDKNQEKREETTSLL